MPARPGDVVIAVIDNEFTLKCVFHPNVDTDSKGNWTRIPRETGHRFQANLDTDSKATWTPVR